MIRKILYILLLLISIISIYLGFNSTIIPNIALYIIIFFYIINFILIILCFKKRKRKKKKKRIILRIVGIILCIIHIIIAITISFVYYKSNSFFNKITDTKYETSNYVTITLKNSGYTKIDNINSIGVIYNEIDTNYEEALEELDEKKKIDKKEYKNILSLITDFLGKKIDAIFINENFIDTIEEGHEKFKDKINIIDKITINKKTKQSKNDTVDITKLNSFNIYISGIDTYGDISNVSRSDVNIIATINLKESKILLTNTPRDYYVQLHGTTGDKDKLTHAGIYGIDMSIKTLEDLYNTKINYYVRVNFSTLIKLVDKIGGIDIYSDKAFTPWTNQSVYVKYGWNHFNGDAALAYSRERMTYLEGDRHRGQNQQQVIEAIIKKITKSKDINTYLNLLDSLENSIQTSIDKKMIQEFINLQIKNNYDWKIETSAVTGYDDGGYTYSYPGQYLYVMQPDYNSIEEAKTKIKNLLNKK